MAQEMIRRPPAPFPQSRPQSTLARQRHDGVDPQPGGSARQAYDAGLPGGIPPLVIWQYVVATLHDAQLLVTQAPA